MYPPTKIALRMMTTMNSRFVRFSASTATVSILIAPWVRPQECPAAVMAV